MKRVLLFSLLLLAACGKSEVEEAAIQITRGGDPHRGRLLAERYGCGTCHMMPGVRGSQGRSGPPLDGFADRLYIAGRVQNTPQNLMLWLQHPRKVDPQTAMPEMGVTPKDAHDLAAFLYTMR